MSDPYQKSDNTIIDNTVFLEQQKLLVLFIIISVTGAYEPLTMYTDQKFQTSGPNSKEK